MPVRSESQILISFQPRGDFAIPHGVEVTKRNADILSASGRSPLRLCSEDSVRQFALCAQADRMSALRGNPGFL